LKITPDANATATPAMSVIEPARPRGERIFPPPGQALVDQYAQSISMSTTPSPVDITPPTDYPGALSYPRSRPKMI
jgi:hypothetical protein